MEYGLGFRSATGQEAWLGTAENVYGVDVGILLHRPGRLPDTSLLLDGTPSPSARWDAGLQSALPVGVSVSLSGGDPTVTVDRFEAAGAAVTVVPAATRGIALTTVAFSPADPPGTMAAASGGTVDVDGSPSPASTLASTAPVVLAVPRPAAVLAQSAAAGFFCAMARRRAARVRSRH